MSPQREKQPSRFEISVKWDWDPEKGVTLYDDSDPTPYRFILRDGKPWPINPDVHKLSEEKRSAFFSKAAAILKEKLEKLQKDKEKNETPA